MASFERITRAGYEVEVEWECYFDNEIIPHQPELKTHPMVQHSPSKHEMSYTGSNRGNEASLHNEGGGVHSVC